MNGKVCLVTGASSGVGLETARGLAEENATVILVSRNESRGHEALADIKKTTKNDDVHLMLTDLMDQQAIHKLASTFKERYNRLDVLVNNAGVFLPKRILSPEGLEGTFAINHIAYFLLTHLLLDVICQTPDARIINVSSNAHFSGSINFADPQLEAGFSGYKAYSQSKLANVLFTNELARRLSDTTVTVNSLHPGVVATSIANHGFSLFGFFFKMFSPFFLSPRKGAETSLYLATSPAVQGVTGKYFDKCKEKVPAPDALDERIAKRLYELSEKLTGITTTTDSGTS